ncbi:MAG: hypothetical protein Q8Q12_13770 [bacterium]|nr:hypothetical protein [bacterium]
MEPSEIRRVVLQVIKEQGEMPGPPLHSTSILQDAARRLQIRGDLHDQRALLSFVHDLFRTGYLAWGHDLDNANPTFCHLTERGRRGLGHLSRDPADPDGYLAYLRDKTSLTELSESYVREALATFNSGCHRATAVMIGAAAEAMVLSLRDAVVQKMDQANLNRPTGLDDWRISRVLDGLEEAFKAKKNEMPRELYDAFEHNWRALTHQIRTVRNAAGHPENIEPVTEEEVHAALWLFPALASLISRLEEWVKGGYC